VGGVGGVCAPGAGVMDVLLSLQSLFIQVKRIDS